MNLRRHIRTLFFLLFVNLINQGFTQSIENIDSAAQKTTDTIAIIKNQVQEISQSQQPNFLNSITSKTAGVMVRSNSGSPGASSTIRIRGNRSILFDNNPLIILDGIPIDNSINSNTIGEVDQSNRAIDINAYDIESIEFVKSMYANVIFGIRGSNGAVIITTKRAKKDSKMKVNLNYGLTINKVNKLPGYQTTYSQGRPLDGMLTWRGPDTGEGYSWGPSISDLEFDGSSYPYDKNGRLVPTGTGNGKDAIAYNNMDNFFVNGITRNFNTSIQGSKDKLTYYFTAGLLNQSGTVPNSDFYRKSIRLSLGYDILKNLNAHVSINYINSGSNNRIQMGSNISGVPLGLFRSSPSFDNGNGKKGKDAANDPTTYQLSDGTQRSYRAGVYDSPYWSINKNPNSTDVDRIIGNLNLDYDLNQNLSLIYKMGFDHWKEDALSGFDLNSAAAPSGALELKAGKNLYFNSDIALNYKRSISKNFKLEGLVGYNYFFSSIREKQDIGDDFITPGTFNLSNTQDNTRILKESNQKIAGLYTGIDLLYANQLSLNLLARNDWASVLPASQNSSTYYGAELVWDASKAIKKEDVLGLSFFSSWGKSGNRPGAYLTTTYYRSGRVEGSNWISEISFPQFGVDGYETNTVTGAPDLGPEITKGIELGFDVEAILPHIGLSYTYYNNASSNVLLKVPVSTNTGFNALFMNTAKIRNYGHEISFFAAPIKRQFHWDFLINLYIYKNLVTSLADNVDGEQLINGFTGVGSYAIADEPFGVIYGSAYRRTDEGVLVIDSNGWPLMANENKVIGDPNPEWTVGVQNKVSFKGLTLSFLVDVRHGGDIWNGTSGIMNYFGTSQLTADERNIQGYVFEGVVVDANGNPSSIKNTTPVDFANPENGINGNKWIRYGFGGLDEENVQDASWVRLREITLTYQLPSNFLKKGGIKSSSISITGRNLLLFTGYSGIDPETSLTENSNGFGLDYFNLPNVKSYGMILNFNF